MGKIKGWKKVHKYEWLNKNGRTQIGIDTYETIGGEYFFKIWIAYPTKSSTLLNGFPPDDTNIAMGLKSESQAKKEAYKYMRSHPNG